MLKKFAREEGASEIFESYGEEPGLPAGVPLLRGKEGRSAVMKLAGELLSQ